MDIIADASLEAIGPFIADFILCVAIGCAFVLVSLIVDSLLFDDDFPASVAGRAISKRAVRLREQARIRLFHCGRKCADKDIAAPGPPPVN